MQDLFVRFFVVYLLFLISWTTHAQVRTENNAPVVQIIKPKTSEPLNWNTLVPYSINVNDREDGNSAYEEIADREVILIVKYLKDSSLVKNYLNRLNLDLAPLLAMSKSTCLNCHAASDKLIGPSFDLIADKYGADDKAKAYLSEKVITGGFGTWGEVKMPPHPDLKQEKLSQIIDWILMQKDNPIQFYLGLEGAIRTQKIPAVSHREVYVLTAAYKDHGLKKSLKDQKLGLQSVTLKMKQ